MVQNKDLERSQYAFNKVKEVNNAIRIDYSNYAKKLSVMIQTNGLVATVAFCKAKGGAYNELIEQLHYWLKDKQHLIVGTEPDLLTHLVNANSRQVLSLTYESIAICDWFKRMVEALIPEN